MEWRQKGPPRTGVSQEAWLVIGVVTAGFGLGSESYTRLVFERESPKQGWLAIGVDAMRLG